ncbi:MAG: carbohydrate kinase family protein [Promethearchaeota archaeon]
MSNLNKNKIVIIGDLFLDILPSTLPINKHLVLNDGETFVDRVVFQRGGCAGNFAAVLANLMPQFEIDFISKVGNDANGDFLIKQLSCNGLNCFISKSDLGTAITIALSYNDGERHFITYNGAMDDFKVEDIKFDLFKGANHLVWRGIWFTPNLLHNSEKFLSIAKSNNLSISMDLGFDPYWVNPNLKKDDTVEKRKRSALKALKYVDYLFGNKQEICELTSKQDLDKAVDVLYQNQVKYVIIHLGSKGAVIYKPKEEKIEIPAVPAQKILNPVGTGDTFDAAFISQILSQKDMVFAAKFAAATASYSLNHPAGIKINIKDILDQLEKLRDS